MWSIRVWYGNTWKAQFGFTLSEHCFKALGSACQKEFSWQSSVCHSRWHTQLALQNKAPNWPAVSQPHTLPYLWQCLGRQHPTQGSACLPWGDWSRQIMVKDVEVFSVSEQGGHRKEAWTVRGFCSLDSIKEARENATRERESRIRRDAEKVNGSLLQWSLWAYTHLHLWRNRIMSLSHITAWISY